MLKLHPSKWDKDNASNTIYHNSSHNYILDSIVFFFKIKMISLLWPQNLWRMLILLWLRHRGHKIFCSQWWRKKSRASRIWNPRKKSAQPLECTPRGWKSANTRPLTHTRDGKARNDPATNTNGHNTRLNGKAEELQLSSRPWVVMHYRYLCIHHI